MMNTPDISKDFTIDDIHKIREYNYERTKDMSFEEQCAYYRKGADDTLKKIEEIQKNNRPSA